VLLAGALADRTRLIVAHRASTAAAADFVIWLEAGGVQAVGTHAELLLWPEYRRVFGSEDAADQRHRNGNGVVAWNR
jgi:ATP-binding cassette subfamily B protein